MEEEDSTYEKRSSKLLFDEGVKERLEELVDGSIYGKYGVLIARGELEFDRSVIEDMTELVRVVSRFNIKSSNLDW